MNRLRVSRAVLAVIATLAMLFIAPLSMLPVAHAEAASDRISNSALSNSVPFTVRANEDISNRDLVAVRLADYVFARTDGTNITGLDVADAGFATKIDAAVKVAKIDTSQPTTGITYDAANPMPWVMENLLQASQKPWEDDDVAKPNLRAFMTALRKQFAGSTTANGQTIYTMSAGADATMKTAQVKPGVYMVLDTTEGDAATQTEADRASIPMINGTGIALDAGTDPLITLKKSEDKLYTLGEVDYKVTEVTTTKTVVGPQTDAQQGEDAHSQIGQQVTFVVTSTVPNYTGYDKLQFKLRDTMSKGLTFNEITSVTVTPKSGTASNLDSKFYKKIDAADVTDNGNGSNDKDYTFDIVFAPGANDISNVIASEETRNAFPVGATVTVTYTATLDKDAIIQSTGNTNTVSTLYSHNPNNTDDLEKTPEEKVTVYTGQISLKKTDMSGKKLAGAQFEIKSNNTALKVIAGQSGTYRIADATEQNDPSAVATMTTPESGILTITGLDGEYSIVETASPFGNGVLLPSFTTTVTTEKVASSDSNPVGAEAPKVVTTTATAHAGDVHNLVDDGTLSAVTTDVTDNTVTFVVKNARNLLDMPKTGATWLAIYAVMAVLFAGAGLALIMRSRNVK